MFDFQSCLALWSPRLGKRGLVHMLLAYLCVYLASVTFCLFSLPLCRLWLRLVVVALPELFIKHFLYMRIRMVSHIPKHNCKTNWMERSGLIVWFFFHLLNEYYRTPYVCAARSQSRSTFGVCPIIVPIFVENVKSVSENCHNTWTVQGSLNFKGEISLSKRVTWARMKTLALSFLITGPLISLTMGR